MRRWRWHWRGLLISQARRLCRQAHPAAKAFHPLTSLALCRRQPDQGSDGKSRWRQQSSHAPRGPKCRFRRCRNGPCRERQSHGCATIKPPLVPSSALNCGGLAFARGPLVRPFVARPLCLARIRPSTPHCILHAAHCTLHTARRSSRNRAGDRTRDRNRARCQDPEKQTFELQTAATSIRPCGRPCRECCWLPPTAPSANPPVPIACIRSLRTARYSLFSAIAPKITTSHTLGLLPVLP